MNRKKIDSNRSNTPKPVRGKYAQAFKRGVQVTIHAAEGDRRFVVRKNQEGEFCWTPQSSSAPQRRRKAS